MSESRSRLRMPSMRVAVAGAILAALWFEMLTLGTSAIDDEVLRALYAGGDPALVNVAQGFTLLGEWWFVIVASLLAGAWLAIARHWRSSLVLLAVTLIGRGLVSAQKYAVERIRPSDEVHLVPVSTPSFPSGHAAGSMMVYLTIALVLAAGTRWYWPAVLAAVLLSICVGLSRVMLGVHWPSDVIGGWAFGLLWVVLALPQAERLAQVPDLG